MSNKEIHQKILDVIREDIDFNKKSQDYNLALIHIRAEINKIFEHDKE